MGFSNVIYKYPRYKDTTSSQVSAICDYLSYEENEWARNNFKCANDYMTYTHEHFKNFVAPTEEQIEYYKQFMHKDEYGYSTISDDLFYSCSAGIPFHEDLGSILNINVNEGSVELTQKDLIKLLVHEVKKLAKYELMPTTIDNSFTYVNIEDEDPDVVLKKCDGVELSYEDGSIKRIETNSNYLAYGTLLMTCKEYVDEYEYNFQFGLVQELATILETVDFDKECLMYSGGW